MAWRRERCCCDEAEAFFSFGTSGWCWRSGSRWRIDPTAVDRGGLLIGEAAGTDATYSRQIGLGGEFRNRLGWRAAELAMIVVGNRRATSVYVAVKRTLAGVAERAGERTCSVAGLDAPVGTTSGAPGRRGARRRGPRPASGVGRTSRTGVLSACLTGSRSRHHLRRTELWFAELPERSA